MAEDLTHFLIISTRFSCSDPPHFVVLGLVVEKKDNSRAPHTSTQKGILYSIRMTVCLFVCVRALRSEPPRTQPEPYYMYVRREREGRVYFVRYNGERCSSIGIILSLPKSNWFIIPYLFGEQENDPYP